MPSNGMTETKAGLLKPLLTSLVVLAICLPPFPAFANSEDDYDNLIRRARVGDTEPALHLLRQMGATASLQKRFDHILIASWANRPAEVLGVYQRLPKQVSPPAAVQIAAARAWRDQKRWTQSLAL